MFSVIFSKFSDELILPFLWAQDGFDEPSEEMAEAIRFGLAAPKKLAMIGKKINYELMYTVQLFNPFLPGGIMTITMQS